jgi:hypothetical protein
MAKDSINKSISGIKTIRFIISSFRFVYKKINSDKVIFHYHFSAEGNLYVEVKLAGNNKQRDSDA